MFGFFKCSRTRSLGTVINLQPQLAAVIREREKGIFIAFTIVVVVCSAPGGTLYGESPHLLWGVTLMRMPPRAGPMTHLSQPDADGSGARVKDLT